MTKPQQPKLTDEAIIPDSAAYAKYPVSPGDDEETLVLKYKQAQADTLIRLLKVKPADLKECMKTHKARAAIRAHNDKMRTLELKKA